MNQSNYQESTKPLTERVEDLVSRMTLEEKISQMLYESPEIARLGIPAYNWWNECLHGVARAGIATVFPQSIGFGATWNPLLVFQAACAISDEARAKYQHAIMQGIREQYLGLTFWSPNINIFRDPRWGRGQETYGEDPYLTGRMGVAFIKGLQGDHPAYLKLVATPKHYAVHSGPEFDRHQFDARVSLYDLHDTYLPAFEDCIKEGRAESIMGAYNRTNGEPCCASPTLLDRILRKEWGFQGYVVSDCGAIRDIYLHHQVVETAAEAAALAVKAGCELNCGQAYHALREAYNQGLIGEDPIDRSVKRLFIARFKLGMFNPPEMNPYAHIPYDIVDCEQHRQLALETARQSIVLLKNENQRLPLPKDLKTLAVIGPNADDELVLLGNYHGTPSKTVTPLQAIRNLVSNSTQVLYAQGCDIVAPTTNGYAQAIEISRQANVVLFFAGLSQLLEGEEGQTEGIRNGRHSLGDRSSLDLPAVQENLLKQIYTIGKPVILVLINGSPISINWADHHLPAILEAWYPGQDGGTAIAEVLFGVTNPAGRLPATFYRSVEDLPPFGDYAMQGRSYRYFNGTPLYRFGHGLSYTHFSYDDLHLSSDRIRAEETLEVEAQVTNTGSFAGDEVVQLYLRHTTTNEMKPNLQLQGFTRIHLESGETKTVCMTLQPNQFLLVNSQGVRQYVPGKVQLSLGGRQPLLQEFDDWSGTDLLLAEFELD